MVEWCKNYLTERKQRVICGELKSEYQNVVYGVPQCSVLGPILFNIYINKLPNIAGDNIQRYADDAVVFEQFKKKKDVYIRTRWPSGYGFELIIQGWWVRVPVYM